ncbi:MAG TPA: MBL fold metallo-hydrolase [Chloroflexota bacterium]|nr:MBL fold metallo-hydrolase [Chloroflexota bacterium]
MCDEAHEESQPINELMIRGVVVGLFGTNCYIVGSRQRGEGVVLDPGDDPQAILALARDLGVRITRVIATHAHLDHVLAAQALKDETGATFLLHADDADILANVPESAQQWLSREVAPPPAPDFWLRGEEDLEIAGVTVRALHTPGHTPGSVSLYAESGSLLFSGDTLFRGTIGRTDLQGGDYDTIIRTLNTTLAALPEDTTVLPGHMQQTTIGAEKATNPFFHR